MFEAWCLLLLEETGPIFICPVSTSLLTISTPLDDDARDLSYLSLSTALTLGSVSLSRRSSSLVGVRPRNCSISSENWRARAALAMIPRPKRARVRGASEVYDDQRDMLARNRRPQVGDDEWCCVGNLEGKFAWTALTKLG